MSHVPPSSATPPASHEPAATESDYEALTAALMQTQRGRWFLAEHARRCREADQADLRAALSRIEDMLAQPSAAAGLPEIDDALAALTRIEQALADDREPPGLAELHERLEALERVEQALAEPREPPGLADIQDKLGALARIEQRLAEDRDPPGLAELHERLEALERVEQALAEPREPPGVADIRDKLGALARIEQQMSGPREISGIAALQERIAAFAESLDSVRAEVAALQPASTVEAERSRSRDDEMMRLLHEQRERLDALTDLWARMPAPTAAVPAIEPETQSNGAAAPVTAATCDPSPGDLRNAPVAAAEEAPVLFDPHTSTADLLKQTMIFSLNMLAATQGPDPMSADKAEDATAGQTLTVTAETEAEPEAEREPEASSGTPPADPAVATTNAAAPASMSSPSPAPPTPEVDPIVQMFTDAPPRGSAQTTLSAEPAGPPEWLVGTDSDEARSADDDAVEFESDNTCYSDASAVDAKTRPAAADLGIDSGIDSEAAVDADQSAPAEAALGRFTGEPVAPGVGEMPQVPGLTELTLELLQKTLFRETAREEAPDNRADQVPTTDQRALPPGSDPPEAGDGAAADMPSQFDLRDAIVALRRALGQKDDAFGEPEIAEDGSLQPPAPAASRSGPGASESVPAAVDALAPVYALSEEERIALFS